MTAPTSEILVQLPRGLAETYVPRHPSLDEMIEPDGSVRPHWRPFVSMMDDLGHQTILSRREQALRLIRENGITHNVYGESDGIGRPWNLDLLPLLLPQDQWNVVAQGLTQRARLLNALLADLYGPATSVTAGLVPPELVYANPGFLRPAHGIRPPQDRWLHVYAADIVRCEDQSFCVLGDRTQAPSGAGYSLENRIVLSRVLPTAFHQCNVIRLAPYFIAMRKMLTSLAPANRENPRVVLLTPGPYNETYFEHAYLARYLGYTLVQGNDLTVRDCRVYLKTLGGLQRVDVILRRVDDEFCDPLELYSESFLGVPGLLQALREGAVAVANAIGAGLLQTPAFFPFLPALCRHLLAEDLKLPSVPTWWCGQPDALKYVLDNLATLVIKPAFPHKSTHPIFAEELSREELTELADQIRARPMEFAAQEQMTHSSTPALLDQNVQSRSCVLRAYLSADDTSYTVMPGGLTRVSEDPDSLVVSLQKGGGSKDIWILGEGPVSKVSLLTPASQPLRLSRGGHDLTSRVADDLFWLGRYIQRAEACVRLGRTVFNRLIESNNTYSQKALENLLRQLTGKPMKLEPGVSREAANRLLSGDDPKGLRPSIGHVRALSRVLRDRISVDAWQILRQVERDLTDFRSASDADDQVADLLSLLNKLTVGFLSFSGIVADSMTRGHAWRFLELGMRIERGIAQADVIGMTLADVSEEESFLLDALLDIADSSLTYRRRYLSRLECPAVLDLLIADETNPRSVAFQVASIDDHLAALPRESTHPQNSPDRQRAFRLLSALRLADIAALSEPIKGRRPALKAFVEDISELLGTISDNLSQIYFTHAAPPSLLRNINQEQTS